MSTKYLIWFKLQCDWKKAYWNAIYVVVGIRVVYDKPHKATLWICSNSHGVWNELLMHVQERNWKVRKTLLKIAFREWKKNLYTFFSYIFFHTANWKENFYFFFVAQSHIKSMKIIFCWYSVFQLIAENQWINTF